jgi:hypothetical protein
MSGARILGLFILLATLGLRLSAATITCGQTITGTLAAASQVDRHTYVGTAGQAFSLGFVGSSSCSYGYNATADLYSPTGKVVSLSHCGTRSVNLTLPISGTYVVLVHDDDYAQTSTYALSIQSFTGGGCASTPIACGQTLNRSISQASEIDAFSYAGTAGQTLSLGFVGSSSCSYGYNASADLYSPTGQKLTTLSHCGTRSVNLTLPATGTYTILVHDDDYAQTSDYGLSIQSFTGGGCASTPIACGQPVTGQISSGSEMDAYSTAGCAGDVFLLTTSGFSGSRYDLYDPAGTRIASVGSGSAANLTLATSGLYTLLVHDDDYAQGGAYNVTLTCLISGCWAPVVIVPPQPRVVPVGQGVSFSVLAKGEAPLTYQWRFNGIPISGARSTTYSITSAQAIHEGNYDVIITNNYGAVTSSPTARLTVLALPQITQQPVDQTAEVGATVTFRVAATGSTPLSYQWQRNSTNIPAATNTTLILPNVQMSQSGSQFSVRVSNSAGAVTSAVAGLTVRPSCNAFTSHDVGDVGAAGGCSRSNCVFTVRGSGEDMERTADAFHFAHQPWIGDGQIVARLLSLEGPGGQAEAGVMMRESLETGSRHVFLGANDLARSVSFRRRLAENAYSAQTARPGTNSCWLRLTRLGNTFIGHYSTNGMDWEYVWFTTLNLPAQVEVGLAVTAHSYGLIATGRFDNVSLGEVTPLLGAWREAGPRMWVGGEPTGDPVMRMLGGFKMLIGGPVGEVYAVKASQTVNAPLASWVTLGTVTNTYGVVPFLDPHALTYRYRFYRLTDGQ